MCVYIIDKSPTKIRISITRVKFIFEFLSIFSFQKQYKNDLSILVELF